MVPNTIHRFHEIVKRGMVIAVDPRLSNVAAKAQEWLPLKAGSDGALAGVIAQVLLVEGLWSREFVGDFKDGKNLFVPGQAVDEAAFAEKETHGVVKWWNLELKDRTPAWGEKETLIPAAQIVRVARAMGKAAPKTAVWMGPGAAMHPRGTYSAMAVHALNGLLGSIDVEGGVWQSSSVPMAKFASPDKYVDEVAKTGSKGKKVDGRGAKDMPAMMNAKPGSGVVTNNIANGMLKDPGAVKVFIASWANFNFSCTGADRWDTVMAKVLFFVHMVTNPSEMTPFADIVLPSTFNSAEGWSIVTNAGNGHGYASIQQGAVKRLWDVKQEETEVMWLLAEKLKAKGFPNLLDYYAQEFKDPETGKLPTTAAEFNEIATKISSAPFWMGKEPLKGAAPINGWAAFKAKGMFSSPKYTLKRGWGGKFATPTKKFEFYSEALKAGLLEHAKKPNKAIFKTPEGITLTDNALCIGFRQCQEACPYSHDDLDGKSLTGETYSVISYNPADKSTQPFWEDKIAAIPGVTSSGAEVAARAGAPLPAMTQFKSGDAPPLRKPDTIEKCTFCHHRTLNGLQPA